MQPPTSLEVELLTRAAGYALDLQTLHASFAAAREAYRGLRPCGAGTSAEFDVLDALQRLDFEAVLARVASLEADVDESRATLERCEHSLLISRASENQLRDAQKTALTHWRTLLIDAVGQHFPNCQRAADCACGLPDLASVTHVIEAHARTLRAQREDFEAMEKVARAAPQGVSVAAMPSITIDPPEITGIPEGMVVSDPGAWGRVPRNDEEIDHGPTGLWLRYQRPSFGPEIVHGGFIRVVNMSEMFVYRVAGKLWADPVTMADDLRWERVVPAPQPG